MIMMLMTSWGIETGSNFFLFSFPRLYIFCTGKAETRCLEKSSLGVG